LFARVFAPPASPTTLSKKIELESCDVRVTVGSARDAGPLQVAAQQRLLSQILGVGDVAAEQYARAHQGAPARGRVMTEVGVVVHHYLDDLDVRNGSTPTSSF
jgi:hypothetical protein